MVRTFVVAVALLVASRVAAQAQQQQTYPPQQQQVQPPPPAAQPPPPAAPSAPPSTAGSQGTSSTAQPGSPGASSQQVVVNPPSSQQPSTATAPPSSTTVINPPPPGAPGYREDVYVEQEVRTNPIATVATDAAWGGLAGLVIGFGVTLVNQFDHWDRDLMIGAGAGVLVGAAVGVAQAAYDASQASKRRRVAYGDGMNRTDRDPVITAPTVGFAFRF